MKNFLLYPVILIVLLSSVLQSTPILASNTTSKLKIAEPSLYLPEENILKLSDEALGPFVWGWEGNLQISDDLFTVAAAKKDPLVLFRLAFRLMRQELESGSNDAGDLAKKILDFMIDEYQPAKRNHAGVHWKYGFDYDGLKEGWWSGMDAFFGPLVLYAGWQQYGETRYRDIAIKSAKLALRSPEHGGVVWKDDTGCWVSEYTWTNMKREDEFHVLNGHLFGLQALYILAALTQDQGLAEGYECGRQGSEAAEKSFYTKGEEWSFYQTTPPVINPTHYLLFESVQYKALELLTNDVRWRTGGAQRAIIFQNAYQPELVQVSNGEYRVVVPMIGAPNPYWPDTYPLELSCRIGKKSFSTYSRRQYWNHLPFHERFILSLGLPKIPDSCTVSIDVFPNGKSIVYQVDEWTVSSHQEPTAIPIEAAISYNTTTQDQAIQQFTIDPTGGSIEGRIELKIDRSLNASDILGLVVESELPTQISFLIEGSNGEVALTDYNDIVAGRPNIILLNRTGFHRQDALGAAIKSLTLRIHSGDNTSEFKFAIKAFDFAQTPSQLESFLRRHKDAYFHIQ